MTKQTLRLAMRREGQKWNAYIASPDTMEDAIPLGSIAVVPCQNNPAIKDRFMELMKDAFADALAAMGVEHDGFDMRDAPEHEKSGMA